MKHTKPGLYDSTAFFDNYSSYYERPSYELGHNFEWEGDLLNFIVNRNTAIKSFLDVGAGSGHNVSLIKQNFPNMHVVALDPSVALLSRIGDLSIRKVIGGIPNLNLGSHEKCSMILLSDVLHHLVGRSVRDSQSVGRGSLQLLREHLDDPGFIVIKEQMWETYLIPNATRTLAFVLPNIASKLNVAVPKFLNHIPEQNIKGLKVCYYSPKELREVLETCGFEIIHFLLHPYADAGVKRRDRFLFLKQSAQMVLIAEKINGACTK
ncbi:MAG: methyltransferase domain-containing protein [Halobacteriota archaeon]